MKVSLLVDWLVASWVGRLGALMVVKLGEKMVGGKGDWMVEW